MHDREHRQHLTHQAWLACLVSTVVAGFLQPGWWWLTIAVAAARGLVFVIYWVGIVSVRRRTRRTGRLQALAALPRRHVFRDPSRVLPSWCEELVSGTLESAAGGWIWRPHWPARVAFRALRLDFSAVAAVRTGSAREPAMPPAQYVQVLLRDGRHIDFLIWDYLRLPALSVSRA